MFLNLLEHELELPIRVLAIIPINENRDSKYFRHAGCNNFLKYH